MNTETLFIKRSEVRSLLTLPECIVAMGQAFNMQALGQTLKPALMHVDADGGEFHIKGGGLRSERTYFALKANGGFFNNRAQFDLPNILGLILLCDGSNGRPLAVMDSIDITILRTGATAALAAKYLARPDSSTITICGCGNQGRIQLQAMLQVLPGIRQVYAWDANVAVASNFAAQMTSELTVNVQAVEEVGAAARSSDVVVTCTPTRKFFLHHKDIRSGTFIAAVGADSPGKQELEPALVASSKLVVDVLEQCANVGELQHALAANLITLEQVHAELGKVVAGQIDGRQTDEEIIIFDTTGSAIQDTAAAVLVYEKALSHGAGLWLNLFD